jgi:subtilisin family serine protease
VRRAAARYALTILLVLAGLGSTLFAQSISIIVETTPSADINQVVTALGGTLLDSMGGNVYLVSVSSIPTVYPAGVKNIETGSLQLSPGHSGAVFTVGPGTTPDFYRNQPAMQKINLGGVSQLATGRGIVIADINAKVDVAHPALIGHLTTGAQFLNGKCTTGSSLNQAEVGFLDQAEVGFLDQAEVGFLDQAEVGFLDQAEVGFLDQSNASFLDKMTPAHGHGTMVAGILAAVAPDAMIMPLQAFDDQGCGSIYNISKAIKYAISHGAQVINMSFGVPGGNQTLKNAIREAEKAGIIVVASAGNDNTSVPQFPAAYPDVVAVAATNLKDAKASFSNYGATISVSAPGTCIISAYPGGYYAEMSGTSFAAPMVAGEAALLRSLKATASSAAIEAGVDNIDAVNPNYVGQLGSGRINLLKALN